MKDEPVKKSVALRSLEERLADQPDVLAELHGLCDEVERALAKGALAHEVEGRLQTRVRELGRRLLGGWAAADQHGAAGAPSAGASRHAKKNSAGKASSGRSASTSKSGV